MLGSSFDDSLLRLAEPLTRSLERDHVNLAVVLDDVDGDSLTIGEGCDVLGSLEPAHRVILALKSLNEDDSLLGAMLNPLVSALSLSAFYPVL